MSSIKSNRIKRKRIRNTVYGSLCVALLIIIVASINLITKAVSASKTPVEPPDNSSESNRVIDTETEDSEISDVPDVSDERLIVCIDAGHGGIDGGTDFNNRLEKNDALNLALALQSYLEDSNVKVVMTRTDDTFLKPSERCQVANQENADYFVSLHRNKGDGTGSETWIHSSAGDETVDLATNIQNGLEAAGIQRNRGVKRGSQSSATEDYIINSRSQMPSCIIELGFINNATDNQLFDQHIDDYAKAIGDAILETVINYPENHKKGDDNTENNTDTTQTSHTIENTPIDLAGLDTTIFDWGQGSNVDEENRPTGSLMYQDKYGKYNAYFIGEGDRTIYLTFDDGYEYGCTAPILDTLKEKNVKGVFFITKPYAKSEPELVNRMIDEGHMVGNHTVTHPAAGIPSMTVKEQQNEINELHNYVKENFNYEMHLFRYPGGKFSEQSLAVVNNCNYKSLFWSFAYVDYDVENQPDEEESLQKLIDKLHSGAIYLLHAESATNANILGDFIDKARELGYEFALFD